MCSNSLESFGSQGLSFSFNKADLSSGRNLLLPFYMTLSMDQCLAYCESVLHCDQGDLNRAFYVYPDRFTSLEQFVNFLPLGAKTWEARIAKLREALKGKKDGFYLQMKGKLPVAEWLEIAFEYPEQRFEVWKLIYDDWGLLDEDTAFKCFYGMRERRE